MTNDLKRRVYEHKSRDGRGFAKKYNVDRLVYFEVFADALSAITREKEIKAGPRRKKVELIESLNPG
jgi:putative endonuclease